MMEYYCSGVLQYASGHLSPIELLYVHRVREGEHVAKASPSPASHHALGPMQWSIPHTDTVPCI